MIMYIIGIAFLMPSEKRLRRMYANEMARMNPNPVHANVKIIHALTSAMHNTAQSGVNAARNTLSNGEGYNIGSSFGQGMASGVMRQYGSVVSPRNPLHLRQQMPRVRCFRSIHHLV